MQKENGEKLGTSNENVALVYDFTNLVWVVLVVSDSLVGVHSMGTVTVEWRGSTLITVAKMHPVFVFPQVFCIKIILFISFLKFTETQILV